MINKGIILAGGKGTRMSPLTKAVNKQLLPIYDKPLIFYPLSILMLAKIKDILIIVNKGELNQYKKILPNGKNLGIKITYAEQSKPKGLPDAFIVGEKFIQNKNVALILGDNFFYGQSLSIKINELFKKKNSVLLFKKRDTEGFGVAELKKKKLKKIYEKPKKFISNDVVTGLYVYKNNVIDICKKMKPSRRGELEVTDLNNILIKKNALEYCSLGRGSIWLDAGTFDDLLKTSEFVKIIQNRSGFEIANLSEIEKNYL